MDQEKIMVLANGVKVVFTPIDLNFIDELEKFFNDQGIPKENIPVYLTALARRDIKVNRD